MATFTVNSVLCNSRVTWYVLASLTDLMGLSKCEFGGRAYGVNLGDCVRALVGSALLGRQGGVNVPRMQATRGAGRLVPASGRDRRGPAYASNKQRSAWECYDRIPYQSVRMRRPFMSLDWAFGRLRTSWASLLLVAGPSFGRLESARRLQVLEPALPLHIRSTAANAADAAPKFALMPRALDCDDGVVGARVASCAWQPFDNGD